MLLKSAVNQQEKEAGCFPIFLKAYYNGTAKAFRGGWVKNTEQAFQSLSDRC